METTCHDCGATIIPPSGCGGTGFATLTTGERVCYPCASKREAERMIKTGRAVLYLVTGDPDERDERGYDARVVTDWPGTLRFLARDFSYARVGAFGGHITRTSFRFTGPDGRPWWGFQQGVFNEIAYVYRCKHS